MSSKPLVPVLVVVVALVLPAGCGKSAETPQPTAVAPVPAAPVAAPAPPADGIPDALPENLTDAPSLNAFAVDLYLKNVPPNVFAAPVFSEEDKAKARKALPLVVAAYDKAIGLYDGNESFYFGRAQALNAMFTDTKDAALKERALADLERALVINPSHSPSNALKEQLSQ